MSLTDTLWISSVVIFFFFVAYTLTIFALIGLSLVEAALQRAERGDLVLPRRPLSPGVSIIVPAYNEAPVVVASTHSLLACDYEPLEVVVVDDGSTDDTVDTLIEAFELTELPVGDRFQVETAPIEKYYVSRQDPRLRVVCKQNGGRADAINAGISLAHHELVAMIDADSLLERDALTRVVEVFATNPEHVLAVGGTVRIANGTVIEDGRVVLPRVSVRGTEATQVGEYLRSFLGSRIAWARVNGLLIISGAFGVFRRDLLLAVGGLSTSTLGEDMELVMRLHELVRPLEPDARIEFAPDATCWTEAPSGLSPLRGQRIRWHVGLIDNVRLHQKLLGRRRFGAAGIWAMPYIVLFEIVAPLLQMLGYLIITLMLFLDLVSWQYALAFFVLVLLGGQLQTAGAILIEEVGFRRYRGRDLALLGCWGLLEIFWYRPLTAWWRLYATVLVLLNRRPGWGTIPRGAALGSTPAEPTTELEPAPLSR